MTAEKVQSIDIAELRRRAEEHLGKNNESAYPPGTVQEPLRLHHELQVQQIELEMQNAEIIQARNEAETALEKFTDLYDFAPVGYFSLDRSGIIHAANLTGARLLGVGRFQLIGMQFAHFLDDAAGHDFATFLGKIFTVQARETCELAILKEGDSPIFVQIEAVAAASGQECRMALMDITERRSLEKQLGHAQKMEAIGTLAGGIAHDFNNILTAIIGFGSLLEMKLAKDDPLHDNVTQILAAADRAANLTGSLLAFSRKQTLAVKPASLNEIVTGMEKLLRHLISEDIELRICLTEGTLAVLADPGQIEQVLLNLTTNARDSMQSGGTITITTEEAELDETFRRAHGYGEPGRYALITFADSGEGMDESVRQRIFEPFFTTKEVGKGTGLGLSVCYGIIKLNGGYIVCYSEPGRGTTFRIYLRLSRFSAEQKAATADGPFAGGTETILLAEDDANVRNLTTAILTEFGYTVIEAQDGVEAVAKFSEQPHDIQLCLFDLIMPKKNGRIAYEEIRKICPDLKVLFMSGYHADITRQGELLNEGESLITKPVMPRELMKRIRELLDR